MRLLILLNLVVVLLRMLLTGSPTYVFLVWNLFLALIPFLLSRLALSREWKGPERVKFFGIAVAWLFFLPNAPYMLTDFYHLIWKSKTDMIWYDIGMLFMYSATSLVLFYASLHHAEKIWKKHFKQGSTFFLGAVAFLCSYAIYLGRYLRLNSWDLFLQPWVVLKEMLLALQTSTFWEILLPFFFFIVLGQVVFRRRHEIGKELEIEK